MEDKSNGDFTIGLYELEGSPIRDFFDKWVEDTIDIYSKYLEASVNEFSPIPMSDFLGPKRLFTWEDYKDTTEK